MLPLTRVISPRILPDVIIWLVSLDIELCYLSGLCISVNDAVRRPSHKPLYSGITQATNNNLSLLRGRRYLAVAIWDNRGNSSSHRVRTYLGAALANRYSNSRPNSLQAGPYLADSARTNNRQGDQVVSSATHRRSNSNNSRPRLPLRTRYSEGLRLSLNSREADSADSALMPRIQRLPQMVCSVSRYPGLVTRNQFRDSPQCPPSGLELRTRTRCSNSHLSKRECSST